MLKLDKCQLIETRTGKVNSSVSKLDEGVIVVTVLENGVETVQASSGVAGEKFAGVTHSQHLLPSSAVASVVSTVPTAAPYEVTIASTPVSAAEVGVVINGAAAANTGGGAGEYAIAGDVITFDAADAGLEFSATYRYNLTVDQANMLFGGDFASMNVTSGVEMSLITTGVVFTDQYVVSDDWTDVNAPVYMGADGKFTTTDPGSGEPFDATIAATPSVSSGFLGIRLKP